MAFDHRTKEHWFIFTTMQGPSLMPSSSLREDEEWMRLTHALSGGFNPFVAASMSCCALSQDQSPVSFYSCAPDIPQSFICHLFIPQTLRL